MTKRTQDIENIRQFMASKTEVLLDKENLTFKDKFNKTCTMKRMYVGYVNGVRTPHIFVTTDLATSYIDVLCDEAIDLLIEYIYK